MAFQLCNVGCIVSGLLLVLLIWRRSADLCQHILTSGQLVVWALSAIILDWWPSPAFKSGLSDQLLVAGVHLAVGLLEDWLFVAFSNSDQWCLENTTPSCGSAYQLKWYTRMWHTGFIHLGSSTWEISEITENPCHLSTLPSWVSLPGEGAVRVQSPLHPVEEYQPFFQSKYFHHLPLWSRLMENVCVHPLRYSGR